MHFEILSDQLGERQRRGAATGRESVELSPERALRIDPSRESAGLRPSGAAAVDAVAICPQRVAVGVAVPQFEDLSLLRHRGTSSNRHRGTSATRGGR
jgi:hypothetical protein